MRQGLNVTEGIGSNQACVIEREGTAFDNLRLKAFDKHSSTNQTQSQKI